MVTDELLQFIKDQLNQGVSEDELRTVLKAQGGWEDADLANAFSSARSQRNREVKPRPTVVHVSSRGDKEANAGSIEYVRSEPEPSHEPVSEDVKEPEIKDEVQNDIDQGPIKRIDRVNREEVNSGSVAVATEEVRPQDATIINETIVVENIKEPEITESKEPTEPEVEEKPKQVEKPVIVQEQPDKVERVVENKVESKDLKEHKEGETKHISKLMLFASVSTIFVLLGGIAMGYFFIFSSNVTPLDSLKMTISSMENVKSYSSDTNFALDLSASYNSKIEVFTESDEVDNFEDEYRIVDSATSGDVSLKFAYLSRMEKGEDDSFSRDGSFNLDTSLNYSDYYTPGFAESIGGSAEFVTIDGKLFFKLLNLTESDFIPKGVFKQRDTWFVVEGSDAEDLSDSIGSYGDFIGEKRDDKEKYKQEAESFLSREDTMELINRSITSMGSSKIEGRETEGIKIKISKEDIDFIMEKTMEFDEDFRELAIESDAESVDLAKELLSNIVVEIWAYKSDNLLAIASVNLKKTSGTFEVDGEEVEYSASMSYESIFKDYNEEFNIEEPPDAKSVSDFIAEGLMAEAYQKSNDARRISDMSQYLLALELFYDGSGSTDDYFGQYPDTLEELVPDYLSSLLLPPDGTDQSFYVYELKGDDNQGYCLGVDLEDNEHVVIPNSSCSFSDTSVCESCDYFTGYSEELNLDIDDLGPSSVGDKILKNAERLSRAVIRNLTANVLGAF